MSKILKSGKKFGKFLSRKNCGVRSKIRKSRISTKKSTAYHKQYPKQRHAEYYYYRPKYIFNQTCEQRFKY